MLDNTMRTLLLPLFFSIPCFAQDYKTTPAEQAALKQLAKVDGQEKADLLLEICSKPFRFSDQFIEAYEKRTAKVTPKKVGTPITAYYPDQHLIIPMIVAIRMTERGKKGQEFNLLLPGRTHAKHKAPYKDQVELVRKLIYSLHHPMKSKGPVRFNWGYYFNTLGMAINNGKMLHMYTLDSDEFRNLKKPIYGRVGPFRSSGDQIDFVKKSAKWSISVSNYFTKYTCIKTGLPKELPKDFK